MDVRNLFELQRAFERHRKVHAPSQIEEVAIVLEFVGDGLDAFAVRQNTVDFLRYRLQLPHEFAPFARAYPPRTTEGQSQHAALVVG